MTVRTTDLTQAVAVDSTADEVVVNQGGVTKRMSLEYVNAGGLIFTSPWGASGALPVATLGRSLLAGDFTITGWKLWGYPAGAIELDIRVVDFGSLPPAGGDSIVAAAPPEITAGISNSSGTLTGWTTALERGQGIEIAVTANAGSVEWFSLLLEGIKN